MTFSLNSTKKVQEIEEAIYILHQFINQIHKTSSSERNKLVVILHCLDHLTRLTKVLRDHKKLNEILAQEILTQDWYEVLTELNELIKNREQLLNVSLLLEQTSQNMAEERKNQRDLYFVNLIDNNLQVKTTMTKVESLLWLDGLIYHMWRSSARLSELQNMKNEK